MSYTNGLNRVVGSTRYHFAFWINKTNEKVFISKMQ